MARKFPYADAKKIKPDCQIGDVLRVEIKSEEFSRRAAARVLKELSFRKSVKKKRMLFIMNIIQKNMRL